MCKLSVSILYLAVALVTSSKAFANGGTYHHAEFVPLSAGTVVQSGHSAKHHPSHLTLRH
jgi:hypothetical protein